MHRLHELGVDRETARSIDDKHVAARVNRFAARLFGETLDGRRIRGADFAFVEVGLDRGCYDSEWLARGRTVDVHRDEKGAVSGGFWPAGRLAGRRGLAGTLQPRHHAARPSFRSDTY